MINQPMATIIAGAIIGAFIFMGMWAFAPHYSFVVAQGNMSRLNVRTGVITACSHGVCYRMAPDATITTAPINSK